MMNNVRLIDANALSGKEEILYQHTASGKIIPWAAVRVCVINNATTIEAAPVVHARWIASEFQQEKYCCSACGGGCWYYDYEGEVAKSRYCPNCGAKMDGDSP